MFALLLSLPPFLRFACVGSAAFIVDAGALMGLVSAGCHPYVARALSFSAALGLTWLANRRLTFCRVTPPSLQEFAGYAGTQSLGGAVNLGVYALAVNLLPMGPGLHGLAVALGSLAGLGVNFVGAGRVLGVQKSVG